MCRLTHQVERCAPIPTASSEAVSYGQAIRSVLPRVCANAVSAAIEAGTAAVASTERQKSRRDCMFLSPEFVRRWKRDRRLMVQGAVIERERRMGFGIRHHLDESWRVPAQCRFEREA